MNQSPIFFYFPAGYADFVEQFSGTGDLFANFNYPGDYVYDALTASYISQPTITTIIRKYFRERYVSLTTYPPSDLNTISLIAYYYPPLKEAVLDPAAGIAAGAVSIAATAAAFGLTEAAIYDRIVYTFQGMTDTVILSLILENTPYLDTYRTNHTFLNTPVNRYTISYGAANNKVRIETTSLNKSILTDINTQYDTLNRQVISDNGTTPAAYAQSQARVESLTYVLNTFYNYLQQRAAVRFGIQYGTFSTADYADPATVLYLQNGTDLSGIFTQYNAAYIAAINRGELEFSPQYAAIPAPQLWPQALPATSRPLRTAHPYSSARDELDLATKAVDPTTGYITADAATRTITVLTDISAGTYTVIPFKSPCRQTLQIETAGRPAHLRYEDVNAGTPAAPYFDLSYSFQQAAFQVPASTLIPFSAPIPAAAPTGTIIAAYPPTPLRLTSGAPRIYFQLDISAAATQGLAKFPVSVRIQQQDQVPLTAALYADLASFAADVSQATVTLTRTAQLSQGTVTPDLSLNVITGRRYYGILASEMRAFSDIDVSLSVLIRGQPIPYTFDISAGLAWADPAQYPTNYAVAKVYDPDFMALNTSPAAQGIDPASASFNRVYAPTAAPHIGYDASGISTDLTDYVSWLPNAPEFRIDPITRYQFLTRSAYSDASRSYFYIGSANSILDASNNNPYVSAPTSSPREYKIVHWKDSHYISSPSIGQLPAVASTATPVTSTTVNLTQSYTYVSRPELATSPVFQPGEIVAISICPTEGEWEMDRFTFKSAWASPGGPNDSIARLRVFPAAYVYGRNLASLDPAKALATLYFSAVQYYDSAAVLSANDGYDPKMGAWYEFRAGANTQPTTLKGYSRTAGDTSLSADQRIYYVVIPYDAGDRVSQFYMPCGSITPDDSAPLVLADQAPASLGALPTAKRQIISAASGTSTSQYEQSLPITTQCIGYKTPLQPFDNVAPTALYDYSPWSMTLGATTEGEGFSQVGYASYELRSGSYAEDTNKFLLFAAPAAATTPLEIEVFRLRTSPGQRDTVYYGHRDLTSLIPVGEIPVTWTAGPTAVYVLTYGATPSTTSRCRIYAVTGLSATPVLASPIPVTELNVAGLVPPLITTPITVYLSPQTTTLYMTASGLAVIHCPTTIVTSAGLVRTVDSTALVHVSAGANQVHVLTRSAAPAPLQTTLSVYSAATLASAATSSTLLPADLATDIFSMRADPQGNAHFLSIDYPTRWLRLGLDGILRVSAAEMQVAEQPSFWDITATGAIWFHTQLSTDFLSTKPWRIIGNAAMPEDQAHAMDYAWQVFYPTMKVGLKKRANATLPLPPPARPEFPHVAAFLYDSSAAFALDLAAGWGRETRYIAADMSFAGQGFGAYIPAARLLPTGEYILALRGYSPAEQFQTMTRLRLSNRYDYGFIDISTILTEVTSVIAATLQPANPNYIASLAAFNSDFSGNPITIPGTVIAAVGSVSGQPLKTRFTGFADFYAQYARIFADYIASTQQTTDITQETARRFIAYMSRYYANVMPPYYFTRASQTDPLRFSLLFKSSVDPSLLAATDNWGLGYNLGFYKKDYTGPEDYLVPARCDNTWRELVGGVPRYLTVSATGGGSTVFIAPNFYRIFDDYIYLRMNDEFSCNRVDSTAAENLRRVQDTTGEIQNYHAKLLLGPFGDYSTSMIYNPVALNPPIARLDKLKFQWVNARGEVMSNNNAEWSAVVYITETADTATLDSMWIATRTGK
jgi:hypothetical protein